MVYKQKVKATLSLNSIGPRLIQTNLELKCLSYYLCDFVFLHETAITDRKSVRYCGEVIGIPKGLWKGTQVMDNSSLMAFKDL